MVVMILRIWRENKHTTCVRLPVTPAALKAEISQSTTGLAQNLLVPVSTAGAEVCLFMSLIHHRGLKPLPWPREGLHLCQVNVIVF